MDIINLTEYLLERSEKSRNFCQTNGLYSFKQNDKFFNITIIISLFEKLRYATIREYIIKGGNF